MDGLVQVAKFQNDLVRIGVAYPTSRIAKAQVVFDDKAVAGFGMS